MIARLVRDGTAVARSDSTLHDLFPVAASAAEALRDWILREQVTRTVEVGLGYGISALHICEGLLENSARESHHVVRDPYRLRGSRTAACSFSRRRGSGRWWNTTRRSPRSCCPDSSTKPGASTSRSSMETTVSTGYSSTYSTSDVSCEREGSFPRRLPVARRRTRGVVLRLEPGLDHGRSLAPGRPAPVGGNAYHQDSRHATIRPLRRFLKRGLKADCLGNDPLRRAISY